MKRNKEEDRSEITGLICSLSIRWARGKLGPHLESQNRGSRHGDISSLTWNQRSGHSQKTEQSLGLEQMHTFSLEHFPFSHAALMYWKSRCG